MTLGDLLEGAVRLFVVNWRALLLTVAVVVVPCSFCSRGCSATAEAEEHERAGRWREALRSRYRELIAQLAAAGLVEEAPGRTTGEYLAAIERSIPSARRPATYRLRG